MILPLGLGGRKTQFYLLLFWLCQIHPPWLGWDERGSSACCSGSMSLPGSFRSGCCAHTRGFTGRKILFLNRTMEMLYKCCHALKANSVLFSFHTHNTNEQKEVCGCPVANISEIKLITASVLTKFSYTFRLIPHIVIVDQKNDWFTKWMVLDMAWLQ